MREPDFISQRVKNSKDIEFYGDLKRETEDAFLFYDGMYEVWLPKSQIVEYERVTTATYRVMVPEWLAKVKGII